MSANENPAIELGIDDVGPANHLGAGGSANVFAAKRLSTGEDVAVKLLRVSADVDKERRRFLREQETLTQLGGHDGVVPILSSGITDRNEPYFLMPLMACSLQDRIDQTGPLDWETAARLMSEVADTVASAHEHGVLHRDLKPGNILLDGEGRPKVSDFGIAKMMTSSSLRSSTALGTPSFMPPERFTSQDATERSDIYGLGATFSALVTGRSPFLTGENDDFPLVMHRVLSDDPPSLEDAEVPDQIDRLVGDAMAKDPADRPPSASDFAQRLREALPAMDDAELTVSIPFRHSVLHARPATREAPTGSLRRKTYSIAAMLVLLLGMVGVLQAVSAAGPDVQVAGATEIAPSNDEVVQQEGAGKPDELADSGSGDGDRAEDESRAASNEQDLSVESQSEPTVAPSIAGPGSENDGSTPTTPTTARPEDSTSRAPSTTTGDPLPSTTSTERPRSSSSTSSSTSTSTSSSSSSSVPEPRDPVPTPCFSISSSSPDVGDRVSFSNCSVDSTSYRWVFGDGNSSTSLSPSHTYTSAGNYTVELTATGPGGTRSTSKRLTVNAKPIVVADPDACFTVAKTSFRAGESLTFTNCSTGATSYRWDFGDGQSSTARVPQGHTWNSPGRYTISLVASNGAASGRATRTVEVIPEQVTGDGPDSPPQQVRCAYVDSTTVTWTWSVFERVDVYIVAYADGTRREVGKNGNHTTTDGNFRSVTARYQGVEKTTSVGNGDCSAYGGTKPGAGAPPAPSGIRCRLHNFVSNAANNNWSSWSETWSWNVDSGVDDYVLTINRDGVNGDRSFGRSGSWTEGNHNGASNSGVSLRAITAVANGQRVTVNISNCLDYGGVWEWHPNYNR